MSSSTPLIHAIIPAGGAGTRLWPLSRQRRPKFLLDLTGSGHTLIQDTVQRLTPLSASITVVTGVNHVAAVRAQLPQLPAANILAEPSARDSMAAIGLAAAIVANRQGRDAIVGSFAADHVIAAVDVFNDAVAQAAALARHGWIATIGIAATEPSSAFGYIHCGAPLQVAGAPSGLNVISFTEKPDLATAKAYLASGDYWWNAGMFVAQAGVLLERLASYKPQLAAGIERIAQAWDTAARAQAVKECWPQLEKIAIDHAIAEPAAADGALAMVPAAMGWTDIGDFAALKAQISPNTAGAARGVSVLGGKDVADVQAVSSDGALVVSNTGRKIVLLGVPDLVVVDTPDALLVTSASQAQAVKNVVDTLKAQGREELL